MKNQLVKVISAVVIMTAVCSGCQTVPEPDIENEAVVIASPVETEVNAKVTAHIYNENTSTKAERFYLSNVDVRTNETEKFRTSVNRNDPISEDSQKSDHANVSELDEISSNVVSSYEEKVAGKSTDAVSTKEEKEKVSSTNETDAVVDSSSRLLSVASVSGTNTASKKSESAAPKDTPSVNSNSGVSSVPISDKKDQLEQKTPVTENTSTPADAPIPALVQDKTIAETPTETPTEVPTETPIEASTKAVTEAPTEAITLSHFEDGYAYECLARLNEIRASAGVPACTMEPRLVEAAKWRAVQLPTDFSHNQYQSALVLFDFWGYSGENLTITMPSNAVQEAMSNWTQSSGHFANMVSANYTCVGIAFYYDQGTDRYYAIQFFGDDSCK